MQTHERHERYTDKQDYAVMTRTTVIDYARLVRIADQLRRNAEDVFYSSNPPTFENSRIAGAMVSWAFNLAPLRIEARFDY